MQEKIIKKIIKLQEKISEKSKKILNPMKLYIKSPTFRRNVRYTRFYKKCSVKDNIILYEAHHGKSLSCNPYALFLELLGNNDFKNYIHIWSLENFELNEVIIERFKKHKNVKFVKRNSKKYLKYLASAKYLINNVSFVDYYIKKDEQIYINTWHGTPLKYLGKDVKNNELNYYTNATRNFLQATYLLSPNKYTTDIFINSYDMKDIYKGKIIEEGYPRNDLIVNCDKDNIKNRLIELGIKIDTNKKIILYAPTWRGNIGRALDKSRNIIEKLENIIENAPTEYEVLIKVHSLEYKNIKDREDIKAICIPDYFDTNELLSIIDVLITDYSSIYFDYLVTEKPILFYMYDKEEYLSERGVYLDLNTLPGPICTTDLEMAECLSNIDYVVNEYKKNYDKAKQRFSSHDNGQVCKKIIDIVFNNNQNYNIIDVYNKSKKKILFYAGSFKTNGVTTSILNLLDNLDYSKYDVSIILQSTKVIEYLNNMKLINKNVRKVWRAAFRDSTICESYREMFTNKYGLDSKIKNILLPKENYKREYKRLFGDIKFDYAIDYCGYSVFFANLLAYSECKNKIIYQHSDMLLDSERVTDGQLKHKHSLNMIFCIYKNFDTLVSVSKSSWEENVKKLKKYAPNSNFVYINNPLNFEKILKYADKAGLETIENLDYSVQKYDTGRYLINRVDIPSGNYIKISSDDSSSELIPFDKEAINFINIGRLSQEKDHEKLINAFSHVILKYPNIKLYLVGDGDKKKYLVNLVENLNLVNNVIFTGNMSNPFGLLKYCDCFILSSNYEGQGLVVLEALILNKPVISTNIPGPQSILENGEYGSLVENSQEGLINGMIDFIENKNVFKNFDVQLYNKNAMDNFYKYILREEK